MVCQMLRCACYDQIDIALSIYSSTSVIRQAQMNVEAVTLFELSATFKSKEIREIRKVIVEIRFTTPMNEL